MLSENTRPIALICAIFLAVGMSQGAVGPALQDLARQTGSTPAAAATLLTAVFAGALLAQGVTAMLGRRAPTRAILGVGMVLFVTGLCGIALAQSLTALLIAAFCKGLGDGALVLKGNVIAAEASSGAGPLNLVNAVFGLGAILSPALIWIAMTTHGSGIPALWAIPCAMLVAATLLRGWKSEPPVTSTRRKGGSVLLSRIAWLVAIFCMLEVGVEVGFSAWIPTLLHDASGVPLRTGALVSSLFWLLMTASRFAASWASRLIGPQAMLRVTVCGTCAGLSLLVLGCWSGTAGLSIVAICVTASALGPVLPTAFALLRRAHPDAAEAATGMAFAACNICGALIPPLLGLLIAARDATAVATVLLGFAVGMAGLVVILTRLIRH